MKLLLDLFTIFISLSMFILGLIGDSMLDTPTSYEFEWAADAPIATLVMIDTTPVVSLDTLSTSTNTPQGIDTLHHKEWFPFLGFKYEFSKKKWSEEDKLLFVNVLSRESGGTVTNKHKEIDQYLVAISALRRFEDKKYKNIVVISKYSKEKLKKKGIFTKYKRRATKETENQLHVPKFVGTFRMASRKVPTFTGSTRIINEKAWKQCYRVVTNILEGTIPDYIPYIPHGTYAYLNSRIDTNKEWIHSCTTKRVVVASTIKDHHYYADLKYMTDREKAHLKLNPHNPVNTRFKDGFFALQAIAETKI